MPVHTHDSASNAVALTDTETAHLLGISRSMVHKLNTSGRLPSPIRFGRAVRWRRTELLAWLAAGCPDRSAWTKIREKGGAL